MSMKGCANLVDLMLLRSQSTPDRTAYKFLSDGGSKVNSLTYGELGHRAQMVASRLVKTGDLGIEPSCYFPQA